MEACQCWNWREFITISQARQAFTPVLKGKAVLECVDKQVIKVYAKQQKVKVFQY